MTDLREAIRLIIHRHVGSFHGQYAEGREEMHPAGQDLYIEDVKRASAALANYRKGTGHEG